MVNYRIKTYIFRPDWVNNPLRKYQNFIVDGKGRPAIQQKKPINKPLPERPTFLKSHQVEVPY